jgi:U3 small nucleolar RNA-associated protein 23
LAFYPSMHRKTHKNNKKIVKALKGAGYREPFRMVAEEQFITAMNKSMLRLKHITDIFKSQPRLGVTKCTYKAYQKLRKTQKSDFCRYLEVLDCGHEHTECSFDCIEELIRNASKKKWYILASNSYQITEGIAKKKKLPVITCVKGSLEVKADFKIVPVDTGMNSGASTDEIARLGMVLHDGRS